MIGCEIVKAEKEAVTFKKFYKEHPPYTECMVPFHPSPTEEDPYGHSGQGAFYTTLPDLSDLEGKKIVAMQECAFSDGLPNRPFAKKKKKQVTGDVIGWVFQVPKGYFWAGHESNGNPATSMTTSADGEDAGDCYKAYMLPTVQEKAEAREKEEARVKAAEDRLESAFKAFRERMANKPSACPHGGVRRLCNQCAREGKGQEEPEPPKKKAKGNSKEDPICL